MNWAVLLAGGSGTRFWPLSTPSRPKQLLPLAAARSSAEEAVARLDGVIPPERILVVTSRALAPVFADALGLPAANVLAEPRAASTAPALAWATAEAARRDPDAVVLSTHSDWHVPDPSAFAEAARTALSAAVGTDRLVTVGIVPTRVETGYGHIIPGDPLNGIAREVARFTEKPNATLARTLMDSGALWNSGIFAWSARRFRTELLRHAPDIGQPLEGADLTDTAAIEAFFAAVPAVPIDTAVLERSDRVAVVPGAFSWDDIGTWDALFRVRKTDKAGNVAVGPVHVTGAARGSLAWSDGPPVVVDGVADVIVVVANGRVLVIPRARAAELKEILGALPAEVRELEP